MLELGIALKQANELAAALDAFLTANNADPKLLDKDAQVSIGDLYLRLNLSQAESWLQEPKKLRVPANQQLHSGLLQLAIIKKDWPAAEKQIEALDKAFPEYLDGSDLSQARQAIAEWRTKKEAAERALAEQKAAIEAKQAEEESPAENSTTETENTVTESKASLSEDVATAEALAFSPAIEYYRAPAEVTSETTESQMAAPSTNNSDPEKIAPTTPNPANASPT